MERRNIMVELGEMKTFDLTDLGSFSKESILKVEDLVTKMEQGVVDPLLSMEAETSDETLIALSVMFGAFMASREDIGGLEVKLSDGYVFKVFTAEGNH
jgi:hypothetical protein